MTSKDNALELSFIVPEQAAMLKTVLQYEARVRGLTTGQTFVELVLDNVDKRRYPDAVMERLAEIREDAKSKAIEEAISSVMLSKSA